MIIVFGSLNIDIMMRVEQMPRPGETVLCPGYQLIAGGKGANQAVAASKAGTDVKLFGKIGDDEFGRKILGDLRQTRIDLLGIGTSQAHSTGCAAVTVDEHAENMITVASGANLEAKESEVPDFLLSPHTTLLLQMETPHQENWALVHRAKKLGAKVILNLAPAYAVPEDVLENLDILVMNQIEATVLALHLKFQVISPLVVAKRIATTFGITCIVTLGKQGAIACTPEGGTWEVEAMDIQAVDTTAAGDAFVGVFAAGIEKGLDIPTALRRASVASGLACLHKGAQTSLPTYQQIEDNLQKITLPRRSA